MTMTQLAQQVEPLPDAHPTLQIQRFSPRAQLPEYHTKHASGMDLCAAIDSPETIGPGEIRIVPTGLAIAVPIGYEAQVRPRSGLASKHGISMPNTPGTIDADYRGEVKVPLINLGGEAFVIESGMRIAQMVVAPVARCAVVEVEALNSTDRGSGGFGSTGV